MPLILSYLFNILSFGNSYLYLKELVAADEAYVLFLVLGHTTLDKTCSLLQQ